MLTSWGANRADRGGPVVRTAGRARLVSRAKLLVAALLVGACEPNDAVGPRSVATPRVPLEAGSTVLATPAAPNVFVGAGQIADSTKPNSPFTANLLDTIPGTVFTLGDNAYLDGSATAFTRERSEEHTSELQSLAYLVCRLLLEKKKKKKPHAI